MKTILLTGANGDLGLEIARLLLEKDYFVFLNYHNKQNHLIELTKKYKEKTYLLQGDVSNEEDVLNMKKKCDALHKKIDVLINNAGIDHVSEMEEKNKETMLKVFNVNTLGPFLMSKAFGSDINEKKGSIINISSDNTIDSNDYVTLEYDISKSGLNMLTKDLALYYKNAYINAIAFSWIDTEQNKIPNDIKPFIKFIPKKVAARKVVEMISKKQTGQIEVVK